MTVCPADRSGADAPERDVVVVTSFNWDHQPPPGSQFRIHRRRSDWGLSRRRAALLRVLDVVSVVRATTGARAVVLSTMGSDMALFSWTLRLLRPRLKIVAFDILIPRRQAPEPIAARLFQAIDCFAVIRRGDISTLSTRYGVAESACTFIHFPVGTTSLPLTRSGEYVYSAGWAHRDWPTLLAALSMSSLPGVVAPGRDVMESVPSTVRIIDMPSPAEGRALAGASLCVVISMKDTHLPAGPLVLLDAMAMGKPIVASDVNGVRDYIDPGETGILVPPKDPEALARALEAVAESPRLRTRLGVNAQRAAATEFSPSRFWGHLDEIVRSLVEL